MGMRFQPSQFFLLYCIWGLWYPADSPFGGILNLCINNLNILNCLVVP